MPWFAAHAVMYVKFKTGEQRSYPVWENVLLIEAVDDGAARTRATQRARADEGDAGGSMKWEGRPAEWVFAGLRKVMTVAHQGQDLGAGDEISYSEFLVRDWADLQRLLRGESVSLSYVE